MNEEMQHQLDQCLAKNSEQLHKLWHQSITAPATSTNSPTGVDPFSSPFEPETLKTAFTVWFQKHGASIKGELCQLYCSNKGKDRTFLITALSDLLTVAFTGVPVNTIVVACILVSEKHLEKWCDCTSS